MGLNSFKFRPAGYDPPPIPDGKLLNHTDLTEIFQHYLDFELPALRGPISKDGLRRLIELAFFASMAPEEGRYTQFNLACQGDFGASYTVSQFDPISLDSVDVLRRLAPSCTHPECALWVTETDEELQCNGVVNVGLMGVDTEPGRPEFFSHSGRPKIQITVLAPGHIMASSGLMRYELREGKIRQVSGYWLVPAVKTFRERLASHLEEALVKRVDEDFMAFFDKSSLPILAVLSTMLRVAVDARHGGAFVIIPSKARDCRPFDIQPKYEVDKLDLASHIIDFGCACAKVQGDGYRRESILSWTRSKATMLLAAEAVGNLSCVDGCVVLNQHLELCGFGAVIDVSDDDAKCAEREFTNYKSGEIWEHESFLREIGGTRHQSAAKLCKAHDNMLIFIASQDGQLKLFSSSGNAVNAFGPLDVTTAPIGLG